MQRRIEEGSAKREALTAAVERALERCASAKHEALELVRLAASSIISHGQTSELYSGHEHPLQLIPAVVKFAEFAPLDVLEEMTARAEREFAYAEWWDRRGHAEATGAIEELGYSFETMRVGREMA